MLPPLVQVLCSLLDLGQHHSKRPGWTGPMSFCCVFKTTFRNIAMDIQFLLILRQLCDFILFYTFASYISLKHKFETHGRKKKTVLYVFFFLCFQSIYYNIELQIYCKRVKTKIFIMRNG